MTRRASGAAASGTLYVVATPIGNLEDVTLRAVRVLREVDGIAAEDTRQTRKLLQHLGIQKPLISYHEHVERTKAPALVRRLLAGDSLALVTDAGTPGIADPGFRLVRAAIEADVVVVPVPGPSAVVAALSVAGLPTDRFVFEGFVPSRSAARRRFFERFRSEPRTAVCLETARRLCDCLDDLRSVLGERPLVVARELTKVHEELVRGTPGEILAHYATSDLRGEVTLLIGGRPRDGEAADDEVVTASLRRLGQEGLSVRDAVRRVADELGRSRREVYQLALRSEGGDE